jgi:hypothetical protein
MLQVTRVEQRRTYGRRQYLLIHVEVRTCLVRREYLFSNTKNQCIDKSKGMNPITHGLSAPNFARTPETENSYVL